MLLHPWDEAIDETEWRSFLDQHAFGTLVAAGRGRELPVVVPTQFVIEGTTVLVHLARPNPVWAAIEENPKVVLSVAGDWSFIPSSWKAIGDEDPSMGIPTTYYAAVQLTGTARVLDEPEAIAAVLRRQLGVFQPEEQAADPLSHGAKLRTIRALQVQVDAVQAKFKYGGNLDESHRRAIVERLDDRAGPGDAAAMIHASRRIHTD